jgi:predicted RNase H-like nuclease (RuvC/YqgF family)
MESKNKKSNNNINNFHYYRFNSTKNKPNFNNKSSKEVNKYKNNEIANINVKNDNSNKKLNRFNYFNNDDNNNNKGLQYKINNIENNNSINTEQEQINKLKKENEELQKYVDKNNKIIFNLKDRCNEQKSMIEELMKKIDEIKKFIPENVLKMEKKREEEKDKFEEQLAIAAVEEQIIKELCPNSSNQQTMEKIFNGEKDSNEANIVKNKIMNIPQVYYKKNEFDNFDCFICYDEFKDNECLKQLMCKHIFHKECLSQWLMNSNNCPICNQLC